MKKLAIPIILLVVLGTVIYFYQQLGPQLDIEEKRLEAVRNITPTPSADIRSMLQVTMNPSVTPKPTAFVLKQGSRGEAVVELQKRLSELGYYSGEWDGGYGEATQQAVILFQQQNNLYADGVVGDGTRRILFGSSAKKNSVTATPTPAASSKSSLLKKGMSGDSVKKMQQTLKDLGYYEGEADGSFGAQTEEAVRLFQRQNNLAVDGIAADATFSVLYGDNPPRVTITPTPDPNGMPLLVNRTHPVSEDYHPRDLVKLINMIPTDLALVKGNDMEADRAAVNALIQMLEGAKDDGITGLQISAAYRSYSYQQQLFNKKVEDYVSEGFSKSKAKSAASQTVADPGTSEHHTGLAFDLTVPGTTFKGTKQEIWLKKHCWEYGFIVRYPEDKEKITGYLAECWHFRYVGLPHSLNMYDRHLCLEEYLGITE